MERRSHAKQDEAVLGVGVVRIIKDESLLVEEGTSTFTARETRKLGIAEPVAAIWDVAKRLGCVHRQLRQCPGVRLRVLGDELDRGFKVLYCGV